MARLLQPSPTTLSHRPPAAHHLPEQPARGLQLAHEVVLSFRAPGELFELVAARLRYGWLWSGGRVGFGAPDEPFGPPQRRTEQGQSFPPVDASGDLFELGLVCRVVTISVPKRAPLRCCEAVL